METLRAHTPAELDAIERRLHDVWLHLPAADAVGAVTLKGLDERSTVVPLRTLGPIAELERRTAHVALVIRDVASIELDDQAAIGSLNVARISFDKQASVVTILGHVPVRLDLRVNRLDIEMAIGDPTVVTDRRWGMRRRSP